MTQPQMTEDQSPQLQEVEISGKLRFFGTGPLKQPDLIYAYGRYFTLLDENNDFISLYQTCREQLTLAFAQVAYPSFHPTSYAKATEENKFIPEKYKLVFAYKDVEKTAPVLLRMIHSLEKEFNFPESEVYTIKGRPNELLFLGSKNWFRAPLLFTLYPLILRRTSACLADSPKVELTNWRDTKSGSDIEQASYKAAEIIAKVGIQEVTYKDPHLNWARKKIKRRGQIDLGQSGIYSLYHATTSLYGSDMRKNFPEKIDWAKLAGEFK